MPVSTSTAPPVKHAPPYRGLHPMPPPVWTAQAVLLAPPRMASAKAVRRALVTTLVRAPARAAALAPSPPARHPVPPARAAPNALPRVAPAKAAQRALATTLARALARAATHRPTLQETPIPALPATLSAPAAARPPAPAPPATPDSNP